MDIVDNPIELLSFTSLILQLLLDVNQSLQLISNGLVDEDCSADDCLEGLDFDSQTSTMDIVTHAAVHQWRLWNSLTVLDNDLGYWVKPRSTTWFSRFLLQEDDDNRWIQMFRMSKRNVLSLASVLNEAIQKKDTKYRLAIPAIVKLACTLFKLSHGASLLVCSETFAVGRSTVSNMLRDVVHAINATLRSKISWPTGDAVLSTAADFYQLCGLPGVLGAIDGMQIPISKPKHDAADYYYSKSGGYSMNCQAVVDSSKRFLDLYVGMPGSMNDSHMLRRSSLYNRAQRNALWDAGASFNGFSPYLLGDAEYPLLPWLMVPHRQHRQPSMDDALFNKQMCKGRGVVENTFALLKQTFKELHTKSDLDVTFLPDVVVCCALLHNVLLNQSHEDVDRLLQVLQEESGPQEMEVDVDTAAAAGEVPMNTTDEQTGFAQGSQKRRDLGMFLAVQHVVPL